jgi:hypothetical protein
MSIRIAKGPPKEYGTIDPDTQLLTNEQYASVCQGIRAAVRTLLVDAHNAIFEGVPGDGGALVQGALMGVLEYAVAGAAEPDALGEMIQDILAFALPQVIFNAKNPGQGRTAGAA